MKKMTLLLFTKITNFQYLGSGDFGAVYRLTNDLAGKIIHPLRFDVTSGFSRVTVEEAYQQLYHEEEMLKAMHQEEIAVPKPDGIYFLNTTIGGKPILTPNLLSFRRPTLVMEYVAGTKISDLVDDEFRHASLLYQEEIGNARIKGFTCQDSSLENGIYQVERDRVVIVDMGLWSRS